MANERFKRFKHAVFSTDYEAAIIGAIQEVFPRSDLAGCLFHLVRNLKKAICDANLMQRYKNDPLFAADAKLITSIAFLPICDISLGIIALETYLPPELQPVLDWFITNYTGRLRMDGMRNQPRFDPAIWSVHRRVLERGDRTNNYAEAAHKKLQRAFSCSHPNIWRFIDTLRKEQKLIDADYAMCQQGMEPPPKRRKYRDADRRIHELVQTYQAANPNFDHNYQFPVVYPIHPIIDFLRGVSHNYNMDP